MLSWTSSGSGPDGWRGASAISGHHDTPTAARELADALHEHGGSSPDLVISFGSFQHVAGFSDAMNTLRKTLQPRCLIGTTAESVLGDDTELDGMSGCAALALWLPGIRITPWRTTPTHPLPFSRPAELPARIGYTPESRCLITFADTFTTPTHRMLQTLSHLPPGTPDLPVVGGLASGGSRPGINRLVLDETFQTSGAAS